MTSGTPQIRRRRQCGPKTRTGCQTCKIRRVKCDEAKPNCHRCSSTGRKCDGYLDLSNPALGHGQNSTLVVRSMTQIPGSTQEKRGFSHFIKKTSPELEGFYSSGFWDALLLQASHAEPALRHAVIAISSLHEDFAGRSQGVSGRDDNFPFALNQYTKAIGHLRRSLASGKQAPLTALMSCILFVCFDSFRGYYQTAMVHLQSGMRILRDLRAQSAPLDPLIEETIAPLLLRLGLQSILYIDTSDPRDRITFARELTQAVPQDKPVPEVFASLEEARALMNECCDGLFRMLYLFDGSVPFGFQAAETRKTHEIYTIRLRDWNVSFEKFMNVHSQSFTSKQVRGAALVKIHHTVVKIMCDMTPSTQDPRPMEEAVNAPLGFVKFTDEFRIIINLCRSLISAAESDTRAGKPTLTFSTDLGVIGPLYYVGVKCTDREIKKEAMELLRKCPRKEGMWDSETAVNLVSQFWAIEERQRALYHQTSDELNIPTPLNEVVDLIFYEGGEWQWVWKECVPTAESTRTGKLNRTPTPAAMLKPDHVPP